jgi:hypothetical protein
VKTSSLNEIRFEVLLDPTFQILNKKRLSYFPNFVPPIIHWNFLSFRYLGSKSIKIQQEKGLQQCLEKDEINVCVYMKNMWKIIHNTNIICPLGVWKSQDGVVSVGLYLEKNIKPPDLIYVFGIIILWKQKIKSTTGISFFLPFLCLSFLNVNSFSYFCFLYLPLTPLQIGLQINTQSSKKVL